MISREQVEEIRKRFEGSTYRYPVQDVLDTLSAALEVVEAAKSVRDGLADHIADEQKAAYSFWKELDDALKSFQQEAK